MLRDLGWEKRKIRSKGLGLGWPVVAWEELTPISARPLPSRDGPWERLPWPGGDVLGGRSQGGAGSHDVCVLVGQAPLKLKK